MTVRAMKAGAIDFLTKPIDPESLFSAVETALSASATRLFEDARLGDLRARHASLTTREQEVMALVTDGLMNKQAAARLNLSEITIKIHRGQVMRKMTARSLAELVRMADQLKGRQRRATGYTPARTVPGDKD